MASSHREQCVQFIAALQHILKVERPGMQASADWTGNRVAIATPEQQRVFDEVQQLLFLGYGSDWTDERCELAQCMVCITLAFTEPLAVKIAKQRACREQCIRLNKKIDYILAAEHPHMQTFEDIDCNQVVIATPEQQQVFDEATKVLFFNQNREPLEECFELGQNMFCIEHMFSEPQFLKLPGRMECMKLEGKHADNV